MGKKRPDEEAFAFRPFAHLKEHLKKRPCTPPGPVPPAGVQGPPSDEEVFSDAMRGVRKIPEYSDLPIRAKKVRPHSLKKPRGREPAEDLSEIVEGRAPLDLSVTQEYVSWVNPAYAGEYGRDIAVKLHGGVFSVRDYIDLHGFTAEEAEVVLKGFLKASLTLGMHCVKIIHGRGLRSPGGPVLKELSVRLLKTKYRKKVIALASARQCDGGLGAVYVLLK